ncbi:MAG: SBBP repeat-containing protein [Candidatus Aminicenantes bacterium]|jgi:hypothetical protein
MKKTRYLASAFSIIFVVAIPFSSSNVNSHKGNTRNILNKSSSLQIPFIENKGQIENDSMKYYAQTFGGAVFVTEKGQIVYSFPFFEDSKSRTKNTKYKGWVIRETLVGSPPVEAIGRERAITKVNTFKGKDPSKWKREIPTYNSVSLGEVYEGIELNLRAYGNNIEKIFTVGPGAHLSDIRLKLEGITNLDISEKGELEMKTGLGMVSFTEPVAYQKEGETRNPVDLAYVIHDADTYGFEAGSYDRTKPLVIDPLIASTFLGAGNGERGNAIVIRGDYVVVSGWARTGFPTTPGAYDETFNLGDSDAFISILDDDLTTLIASTYLGGNQSEPLHSLTVDDTGNIYITGYTDSADFPTTPGAYNENFTGLFDVFVSKLNWSLDTLLASTLIGGTYAEYGHSITLDESDDVYITGYTYSTNYPTTSGAYDETDNPGIDVFISKFDNGLTSLLASTYLGGNDGDFGNTLFMYGTDTLFVAGDTRSTDFPTTSGVYDESFNGGQDVFIAKFDTGLSTLSTSTLIGGDDFDRLQEGISMVLDASGNVYIAGETYSANYPTTPGAYDESYNGGTYDAFVSLLNNSLNALVASTYVGGNNDDSGSGIVLDDSGNVFITGYTNSSNFPTIAGAFDTTYNGEWDYFISQFNSSLSSLQASTFLGGNQDEGMPHIATDGSGGVYITGYTYSSDFPSTSGAYDEVHNGDFDVIISKLDSQLSGPELPLPDIKANGSDGPITISRSDTISITVALDSGDYKGVNADWWVICRTTLSAPNDWFYFHIPTQSWKQGKLVSRQGPLADFSSTEILNRTGFPACTCYFYFGVDMNMNGSIDPSETYSDRVRVNINP